ncbi:MAG: restriction endonuclease [Clostridia bacterium]|nr:restriction endonuclease [Clostridia bacterium]
MKDIKQKEIENDLFESPKKKTVVTKSNVVTFSPIDRIDRMTGEQFEIFMEDYFIKQGFKVKRTPLSGDYGIDLIIENDFSKIGIQAKCYSNKITASAVQEAVAGLRHYGLSSGMVVTNNYFQPAAIQLAKENSITLWDRNMLIKKLND